MNLTKLFVVPINGYVPYVTVIIICYFIGSIPTSYLLGKFIARIDIRTRGSMNVGASNLYVNGGKVIGIIAGTIDCLLKGTFIIILLDIILGLGEYVLLVAGVGLITGHNWSVFIGFKGGRGIATALGVIVGFQMWEEILVLILFVGILGRLIVYKDSGFWCFVAISLLPILCFAFGKPSSITYFSVLLGSLLIFKRLISNGNFVPEGSVTSTIFCRLIFDRDILSKDHWVRRG